jgi:hypothetical protein
MTAEQLIKSWCDDSAEHSLIYAHNWNPFTSRGVLRLCEICGDAVSVWPDVAEKAATNPRVHILCKPKCMALSVKISGPVPYGGAIRENVLPTKLREFE